MFGNTAFIAGDTRLAEQVTLGSMCVLPFGSKIDAPSTTWTGNPATNFGLHRNDDSLQTTWLQEEACAMCLHPCVLMSWARQ